MKTIFLVMINIFLLCLFACGNKEIEKEKRECLPPELEVKNCSEYIIEKLYIHENKNYLGSGSVSVLSGSDVISPNSSVSIAVTDQESKYFTFIRDLTTTSGPGSEIAVTTPYSVLFQECNKYRLNILEEDFLLERFDNYEDNE